MNWYKINKFSQLKSFQYKIPEDPERLMYDFYMLTLLRHTGNEYLDYALNEAEETLLPYLKNHLLDVVFFSVCAEFRHAFNSHFSSDLPEEIDEEFYNIYGRYRGSKQKNPTTLNLPEDIGNTVVKEKKAKTKVEYIESFVQVYSSLEQSGLTKQQFMEIASATFDSPGWESGYGGQSWANIAEGWLQLNNAKNKHGMIVFIDHIYDLQHNSDTVFNKLGSYAKKSQGTGMIQSARGNHEWISNALDYKANIKSPYELIENVSRSMRRLADHNLYANYKTTEEQFYKENKNTLYYKWYYVLKEHPGVYNDLPVNIQNLFSQENLKSFWKSFLHSRFERGMETMPDEIKELFFPEEWKYVLKTYLETYYASSIDMYFKHKYRDIFQQFVKIEEVIGSFVKQIQQSPITHIENWESGTLIPLPLKQYIENNQSILFDIWKHFLENKPAMSLEFMPEPVKQKMSNDYLMSVINKELQSRHIAGLGYKIKFLNILFNKYLYLGIQDIIVEEARKVIEDIKIEHDQYSNMFDYISGIDNDILELLDKSEKLSLSKSCVNNIIKTEDLRQLHTLPKFVENTIGVDSIIQIIILILNKYPIRWMDIPIKYKQLLSKNDLQKVIKYFMSVYLLEGFRPPTDLDVGLTQRQLILLKRKFDQEDQQITIGNVYDFMDKELNPQKQTPVNTPQMNTPQIIEPKVIEPQEQKVENQK